MLVWAKYVSSHMAFCGLYVGILTSPLTNLSFNYKLTNFEGRIFITIISYYSQSEGYFKDIPLHFVKFAQVICIAQ